MATILKKFSIIEALGTNDITLASVSSLAGNVLKIYGPSVTTGASRQSFTPGVGGTLSVLKPGFGYEVVSSGTSINWDFPGVRVLYGSSTQPPANIKPSVTATLTANNVPLGTAANATASPFDSDGTITRVELYDNTALVGTDTASPFVFSWTPTGVGPHSVYARAYDNSGDYTDSAPVTLTVAPPGNVTPEAPTESFNNSTRVLSWSHPLGTSELEISQSGGAYGPYADVSVSDAAHALGEWYVRVKAADGRNVSQATPSRSIDVKPAVPPGTAAGDRGIAKVNIDDPSFNDLNTTAKQSVSYTYANANGSTYLDGNLPSGTGQEKGAGNFSWILGKAYDKVPFNLYFPAKTPDVGMLSGKTRRFIASNEDVTFLRDPSAYDLCARFNMISPEWRHIEVTRYQKYYGLFIEVTKIDKQIAAIVGSKTIIIEKVIDSQTDTSSPVYWQSNSYSSNFYGGKWSGQSHGLVLGNPEDADATPQVLATAKAIVARLETALGYPTSDLVNGIYSVVDKNSYFGNFFVQEFTKNPDGESHSSFMYIGTNGMLFFGPWDFGQSRPAYQNTDTDPQGHYIRFTPHYAPAWDKGLFEDLCAFYQANRQAFNDLRTADLQRIARLNSTGVAQKNNAFKGSYAYPDNTFIDGTTSNSLAVHDQKFLDFGDARLEWFDRVYGAPTYGYIDRMTFTDSSTNKIVTPLLPKVKTVRIFERSGFIDVQRRTELIRLIEANNANIKTGNTSTPESYDVVGGTLRINGKLWSPTNATQQLFRNEWQCVVFELPAAIDTTARIFNYAMGQIGRIEFYSGNLTDAQCTQQSVVTEAGLIAGYNSQVNGINLIDESGNNYNAILYGTLPTTTRTSGNASRVAKPASNNMMLFNADNGGSQYFKVKFKAGTYRFAFWAELFGETPNGIFLDPRDYGGSYYYMGESGDPDARLDFLQTQTGWNFGYILQAASGPVRIFASHVVIPQDCELTFGRTVYGNLGFKIKLGNFRIYKGGSFTAADVAYEESAPTDNIFAEYALSAQTVGGVIPDASGNGNDATLVGF